MLHESPPLICGNHLEPKFIETFPAMSDWQCHLPANHNGECSFKSPNLIKDELHPIAASLADKAEKIKSRLSQG